MNEINLRRQLSAIATTIVMIARGIERNEGAANPAAYPDHLAWQLREVARRLRVEAEALESEACDTDGTDSLDSLDHVGSHN